ncbi:MAG: hypothetical protein CMP56_02815 [Flavobacteriales bacterium]|nr:hypothetical protein [Flavobacteriales bacterium]
MTKYNFFLLLLLCPLFLFSQNNILIENKSKIPNDVKWVVHSSEYVLLCEQIYRTAWLSIKHKLMVMNNPVIIMDLDETVLDNSEYQINLFIKGEEYQTKSWNRFVKKEISTLVPGAKEFIEKYKRNPNARIIYISNRDASTLSATKNNMKVLGIYAEEDIFLLKQDKNDSKVIRREEVFSATGRMKTYGSQKIIAYFGDAVGDFPNDEKYEFGINKFIFPNPMYGEWD